MATIYILRKTYEQIKRHPLFFFNDIEINNYDAHSVDHYWVPEAGYRYEDRQNRISLNSINSNTGKILFAFGRVSYDININSPYVTLVIEPFESRNIEHVKAVLSIFLQKSQDHSDKYAVREFLWMLNAYPLDINILNEAICSFENSIQSFFWSALNCQTQCLSIPKQSAIQQYLSSKGINYQIYYPNSIKEALAICYPDIDFSKEKLNIFLLINNIIWKDEYKQIRINPKADAMESPSNIFLQIRKWLKEPEYVFSDFETLSIFFRLFNPGIQLQLIKRYFHSIRCGQTMFDKELVEKLKNNQFENWAIFYHCTQEPSRPINLAVPLLCDNILTFLRTNFTELQTINGTLDMAYTQCDKNSPEIDFGLKRIIPVCQGGAIPNLKFKGFICTKTVFSINEKAFSPKALITLFRKYLSNFGRQIEETICLNKEIAPQTCQGLQQNSCTQCPSFGISGLDKYVVSLGGDDDNYKRVILNFFTDMVFNAGATIFVDPKEFIISPEESKKRIISWCNQNLEVIDGLSVSLISGGDIELHNGWSRNKNIDSKFDSIINDFLEPSWCYIEPRRNAYIGCGVLYMETGFDEEFINKYGFNDERIQQKENEIIISRVNSALSDQLTVYPDSNGRYCVPYDEALLRKLSSDFYNYSEEDNSSTFSPNNNGFLTKANLKYDRYCAPKYDNDKNLVTQLPFMWCRGKECFKNSLANQTLESCISWSNYTLLHILEIMGHAQIVRTEAGNEASEVIRSFIGMVNQASNLFKRSRCRECNHMLFVLPGTSFNRYNKFQCRLPSCGEFGKTIYLSQCFHCKRGMIDSRDSAKCPNGWHICPKCLSCCDDGIYEKMANRYMRRRVPIPLRIQEKLGHGHNDKDEYFCPKCGQAVNVVFDQNTGRSGKYCEHCHTLYENY